MIVVAILPLYATNLKVYQYCGVEVEHQGKKITLEREISPKCMDIAINNENIWEGNYAGKDIPSECKAMFVTSVGQIQPISMHPDIETYGEMEVMHAFKQMQGTDKLLLVDTRDEEWYRYRTIPSAVNISHHAISEPEIFAKEFQEALNMMGVKVHDGKYDFSQAKILILFCNGAWCSQSSTMIKDLLKLGYPAEKLKWYRGGMHDWLTLSMTTTRCIKR